MNFNTILPFVGLFVVICIVSKFRAVLAGYAMFRPSTSMIWAAERFARGFQLAMITLLVIGTASIMWKDPPDWRPVLAAPPVKESPHVIIQTEFPPVAIDQNDPYWLQREKRKAMLDWAARSTRN